MGLWSTKISGTSSDSGYGIAVDISGNSYITGQYASPATVYNSNGTAFTTLSGSGSTEAFIVKYGTTGMGLWSTKISGTSSDSGNGISVDSSGNSYVIGEYISTITIYNSDGTAFTTQNSLGASDIFVVKYGSTGMGIWSTKIGGSSSTNELGKGIAVDGSGNSYIIGSFNTPATIYNSDGTAYQTITLSGGTEAFIVKYGSTGMGTWSTRINSSISNSCNGIVVDGSNNIYVTGQYGSPATIYNSDGTVFRNIDGKSFVIKYNNGPDSISSYFLIDLDNIESNNGKTIIISNKVYQTGFILNVQTQSFVTYLVTNVTTSISLVFFNGSWIVTSQS